MKLVCGPFWGMAMGNDVFVCRVWRRVWRLRIQLCCGSYEAYFAELEPQYAVE